MLFSCRLCEAKIRADSSSVAVECPACGARNPVPRMKKSQAKSLVKSAPTGPRSTYAWLIGVPAGILLLAMTGFIG